MMMGRGNGRWAAVTAVWLVTGLVTVAALLSRYEKAALLTPTVGFTCALLATILLTWLPSLTGQGAVSLSGEGEFEVRRVPGGVELAGGDASGDPSMTLTLDLDDARELQARLTAALDTP